MEEKKKRTNQKTKTAGNGEGSLYYSEAQNKWIYQYTHNGKRSSIKQKNNEKVSDFKARVTEIKSSLNNGTYIEKSKDTFISILKRYVEQKHKDGITSDRSYCRELSTIKQIEKTCDFVDVPIQKITVEDIENCKENMRKYSNAVISKIWILINKTFKIAYSRRKISFNIMDDETLLKPISEIPDKKIEAFSRKEEQKLVDILNNEEYNHKYRDIILLELFTGMRIGEILALKRDSINLEKNTITVCRSLTYDKKNNLILVEHTKTYNNKTGVDKGKRTFPMTTQVRNLINKILQYKTKNIKGMLFYDYQNNSYIKHSEINSYLKRINEKYHICSESIHSHRLRHTFITRCVEKGMNLNAIQAVVGHVEGSSITSDVYTTVTTDFMEKELQKIQ